MQERLNAWMPDPERLDTLAQRLRHARTLRQMTQKTLEKSSGVKQSDLSKLERGDSLSTTRLVEIASALGVSPGWLASGDGPSPHEGPAMPPAANDQLETTPVQPTPTLGATLLQLGALAATLSEVSRDGLAQMVAKMVMNPELAPEVAAMADAMAQRQRLPVRDGMASRSFGKAHANPVETGLSPLETHK